MLKGLEQAVGKAETALVGGAQTRPDVEFLTKAVVTLFSALATRLEGGHDATLTPAEVRQVVSDSLAVLCRIAAVWPSLFVIDRKETPRPTADDLAKRLLPRLLRIWLAAADYADVRERVERHLADFVVTLAGPSSITTLSALPVARGIVAELLRLASSASRIQLSV